MAYISYVMWRKLKYFQTSCSLFQRSLFSWMYVSIVYSVPIFTDVLIDLNHLMLDILEWEGGIFSIYILHCYIIYLFFLCLYIIWKSISEAVFLRLHSYEIFICIYAWPVHQFKRISFRYVNLLWQFSEHWGENC